MDKAAPAAAIDPSREITSLIKRLADHLTVVGKCYGMLMVQGLWHVTVTEVFLRYLL
jgi:hypothetical protein